jgi:cytochrome c-type biogenesis protein CcmH/NrfF
MERAMPNYRRRRTMLVLLALAPLALASLEAQDQRAVDRDASYIFNTVMSPFCPGRLLSNCPSAEAADLRDAIRAKLHAGASRQDVLDELYDTYGEEILGSPRGAMAWLVPIGVIVAGGIGLLLWLRVTSRRLAPMETTRASLDPESEARVNTELSKL